MGFSIVYLFYTIFCARCFRSGYGIEYKCLFNRINKKRIYVHVLLFIFNFYFNVYTIGIVNLDGEHVAAAVAESVTPRGGFIFFTVIGTKNLPPL